MQATTGTYQTHTHADTHAHTRTFLGKLEKTYSVRLLRLHMETARTARSGAFLIECRLYFIRMNWELRVSP